MELSTGDILAISAVLVSAGVQLGTLASLRQRVSRLESGTDKRGKRIGDIETEIAVLSDRIGYRRRLTAAPVEDPGESAEIEK